MVAPPSLPHPKSTMHRPSAVQQSFWLNPDGARSKWIPCFLHLHCNDSCNVIVIQPWTPQSSGIGAFSIWGLRCCCILDQLYCCCYCVCSTCIFVIWTSPSIRNLNCCTDVQRSYKHNLWHFCYKFKPDRAGIVNFLIPAIHSTYVTFYVKNDFQ